MGDLRLHSARKEFRGLAALALLLAALSVFGCADRLVWLLEVLPVLVVGVLAWTCDLSPSRFLARWMFLHALVLIVGAHYTYAQVPAGHAVAAWLGQTRNPYDRLGHFMQGLIPALLMREYLIRTAAVRVARMAAVAGVLMAVAFSACYEIFEWFAAVALGQQAEVFLATQGFVWDTQADMLSALVGSVFAMTLLRAMHDRSLARVSDSPLVVHLHSPSS